METARARPLPVDVEGILYRLAYCVLTVVTSILYIVYIPYAIQ